MGLVLLTFSRNIFNSITFICSFISVFLFLLLHLSMLPCLFYIWYMCPSWLVWLSRLLSWWVPPAWSLKISRLLHLESLFCSLACIFSYLISTFGHNGNRCVSISKDFFNSNSRHFFYSCWLPHLCSCFCVCLSYSFFELLLFLIVVIAHSMIYSCAILGRCMFFPPTLAENR